MSTHGFTTRLVQSARAASATSRTTPIYLTAGFPFDDLDAAAAHFTEGAGYAYTRIQNPTIETVERNLAALEGGSQAILLASGQAATVTASKAGADCLLALGRDYVRFAIEKPQLYRLMFGAGVVTWMDQPHIAEVRHTAVLPVREALEDHLTRIGRFSPAALETAATSAFAIVHGMAMLRIDQFMSTPASVGDDADLELSSVLALYISGVNAL